MSTLYRVYDLSKLTRSIYVECNYSKCSTWLVNNFKLCLVSSSEGALRLAGFGTKMHFSPLTGYIVDYKYNGNKLHAKKTFSYNSYHY